MKVSKVRMAKSKSVGSNCPDAFYFMVSDPYKIRLIKKLRTNYTYKVSGIIKRNQQIIHIYKVVSVTIGRKIS